jgi:hypothetical protein
MSKATHTIITRRSLVAATAAGVSAAAAAPSSARALAFPDPILALIAAHRAAHAEFNRVCRFMFDLEEEIPEEKREEWFRGDRAKGLGANDDPRWTAGVAAFRAASDAEEAAAWALAHAQPLTLVGAATLLRYAHGYEAAGDDWPCEPERKDSEDDWHGTFHLSLAAALEAMV